MSIREEVESEAIAQRQRDMEQLLAMPAGRRVLFDLIRATGTFDTSFTGNSGSYFNDGRKKVGQDFFHEIMRIDPERFTQMWREYEEAEARAAAKLEQDEEF